jgi:hypothetical protein
MKPVDKIKAGIDDINAWLDGDESRIVWRKPDTRSPQYCDGQRNAIKWAIQWIHDEAKSMNDPHAKIVLNNAAFHMGVSAKEKFKIEGEGQ